MSNVYQGFLPRTSISSIPKQFDQLDHIVKLKPVIEKTNGTGDSLHDSNSLRNLLPYIVKRIDGLKHHKKQERLDLYVEVVGIILQHVPVQALPSFFVKIKEAGRRLLYNRDVKIVNAKQHSFSIKEPEPKNSSFVKSPRANKNVIKRIKDVPPEKVPRKGKRILKLSKIEGDTINIAQWLQHAVNTLVFQKEITTMVNLQSKALRKRIREDSYIQHVSIISKSNARKLPRSFYLQGFSTYSLMMHQLIRLCSSLCTEVDEITTEIWMKSFKYLQSKLEKVLLQRKEHQAEVDFIVSKQQEISRLIEKAQKDILDDRQKEIKYLQDIYSQQQQLDSIRQESLWYDTVENFIQSIIDELKAPAQVSLTEVQEDGSNTSLEPGAALFRPKYQKDICYLVHLSVLCRPFLNMKLSDYNPDIHGDPSVESFLMVEEEEKRNLNEIMPQAKENQDKEEEEENQDTNSDSSNEDLRDVTMMELDIFREMDEIFRRCEEINWDITSCNKVEHKDISTQVSGLEMDVSPKKKEAYRSKGRRNAGMIPSNLFCYNKTSYKSCLDSAQKEIAIDDFRDLPESMKDSFFTIDDTFLAMFLSVDVLSDIITSIYSFRVEVFEEAQRNGYSLQESFWQIIYNFFYLRCGVPSAAEYNLAQFIINVKHVALEKSDEWISLFSSFIGLNDVLPSQALEVFLLARTELLQSSIRKHPASEENIEEDQWVRVESETEYSLFDTATHVIKAIFQDSEDVIVDRLCHAIRKLSTMVNLRGNSLHGINVSKSRAISTKPVLLLIIDAWKQEHQEISKKINNTIAAGRINIDGTMTMEEFYNVMQAADPKISKLEVLEIYQKATISASNNQLSANGYLSTEALAAATLDKKSLHFHAKTSWKEINHEALSTLKLFVGKLNLREKNTSRLDTDNEDESITTLKELWRMCSGKFYADIQKFQFQGVEEMGHDMCKIRLDRFEELLNKADSYPETVWQAYRLLWIDISRTEQKYEKSIRDKTEDDPQNFTCAVKDTNIFDGSASS